MIKILFSLCLAVLATQAQASVYECSHQGNKVLVAEGINGTSLVFEANDGNNYQAVNAQVSVIRPDDGRRLTVIATANQAPIDWSKNPNTCYVRGTNDMRLLIKVSISGDLGSELTLLPRFIVNPSKERCSLPRPLVLPVPITCRLL